MRNSTFAKAARRWAAPPKASKEVQVPQEDFPARPLPPPTKEKDSRTPVFPMSASTSWNWDAKPATPKTQRVEHMPSCHSWTVVQTAPQSHEPSVHSLSEPPEEDMNWRLPVLQSPLSSASTDATGSVRNSAKKKPQVILLNEPEDLK